MDQATKNDLLRRITELENLQLKEILSTDEWLDYIASPEHEKLLHSILRPLLVAEGYTTEHIVGPLEYGPDFFASREEEGGEVFQLGVKQKHCKPGESISGKVIEDSITGSEELGIDRLLVVINAEFTEEARDIARRVRPGIIELLDIPSLRDWVRRIDIESDIDKLEIEQIMKAVSNRLAALVAEDFQNLDKIEWRQFERLIADVFDGLGFEVTLTPESKDKGKDVILEFTAGGKKCVYIVEIKHWRSGKRVLGETVKNFVYVMVREKQDGGLFLAPYGFANSAFRSLTEIERRRIRYGTRTKVVALCRTYRQIQSGILSPPSNLTEIIHADTN